MKKYLTLILLVGFAGWTLFGLYVTAMSHHKGSPMNGDCPLSTLPSTACPDTLAMAVYHVSTYQSLLNSFVYTQVAQVLMVALSLIALVYVFRNYLALIRHLLFLSCFWRLRHSFDLILRNSQGVTRWLSLLLNSPSIV